EYHFQTVWRLDAPVESVWDAILRTELWPEWWPGVESVKELEAGDDAGIGSVRHFVWKSRLPYRLGFDMVTERVEPFSVIQGRAVGELDGTGRWTFATAGGATGPRTVATYDWRVSTT